MKNLKSKQPIELTEEETYELVNQIAKIEYSRDASARLYQDAEDGAVEVLTYALEKDARGKKGLNSYYKHLSMSHFKNLMHFEIRNNFKYHLRKPKVQKTILECDSLDRQAYYDNENVALGDIIAGDNNIEQMEEQLEENLELNNILSKIDNTIRPDIYIKAKYGNKESIQPFNYQNLTKLYYDYGHTKMLGYSDFRGILFNKEDNTALDDKKIRQILKEYKNYLLNNNILGGALA